MSVVCPQVIVLSRGTADLNRNVENHLKNISRRNPRLKLTVFTGVSGSGKTSIVFDLYCTFCQLTACTLGSMVRLDSRSFMFLSFCSVEQISTTMADRSLPSVGSREMPWT